MFNYHIGIDFGTSQTKICSINLDDNILDRGFVFHKFSKNGLYVLPSSIYLTKDGKCLYGLDDPNLIRYFKMKSLFEDLPRYQINDETPIITISQGILANHPEICSILYLAYCIIDVVDSFEREARKFKGNSNSTGNIQNESQTKKNLFGRLFGAQDKSNSTANLNMQLSQEDKNIFLNNYFYCIGIPTEYDRTEENYSRRCKQYEILYLSVSLSKRFKRLDDYCNENIHDLLKFINDDFIQINPINIGLRKAQSFYEDQGMYVIAETTAGIVPFRNDLQRTFDFLPNEDGAYNRFRNNHIGNYITMDVGAGTTDISFFNFYLRNGQIRMKYYASKSIPIASNFLILRYLDSDNLDQIIGFDIENIDKDKWNISQKELRKELFDIIRAPESNLYQRVVHIFNNRPREQWHFEFNIAKGCKVYGGGSRYNEFSEGLIMLHNGGVKLGPLIDDESKKRAYKLQTFTKLERFINSKEFRYNIKLVYPNGSEFSIEDQENILISIDILNTALGLALIDSENRPDGKNGWIDPSPPETISSSEDGMALYDIFNRDWI